jgi:Fe2+ transport system protein FeoA
MVPLHVRLGTTDVILRRKQAAQIEVLRGQREAK